jgi:hypothetical protein
VEVQRKREISEIYLPGRREMFACDGASTLTISLMSDAHAPQQVPASQFVMI